MKDYKEFIFSLIAIDENLIILNKNENMFNFMTRCKQANASTTAINLFHKETLQIFDDVVRILANIIFERVPEAEGVTLEQKPTLEEFMHWVGTLQDSDWFIMLYYFYTRGYVEITNAENLEYLLNVHYTLKVTSND